MYYLAFYFLIFVWFLTFILMLVSGGIVISGGPWIAVIFFCLMIFAFILELKHFPGWITYCEHIAKGLPV